MDNRHQKIRNRHNCLAYLLSLIFLMFSLQIPMEKIIERLNGSRNNENAPFMETKPLLTRAVQGACSEVLFDGCGPSGVLSKPLFKLTHFPYAVSVITLSCCSILYTHSSVSTIMVKISNEALIIFIEIRVLQTPTYNIGPLLFCHICPKPM